MTSKASPPVSTAWLAALIGLGFGGTAAHAAEDEVAGGSGLHVSGYMRTWASFNLQDPPETPQDDRGDLSMLRGALSLNADLKTGPLDWKAVVRADREYRTKYLERLESINRSGALAVVPGSDILSLYNRSEIRELFVDLDPTDRLHLRLGKQQVVWGETDFFHLTDLISGFDYRWRSFLERENDEVRKPLILLNAKFDVPEADGALQVIVRPGFNRKVDTGNTYDLSGSRWSQQPNKGVDFLAPGALTYDHAHPAGNTKDTTGGFRWSGIAGHVSYSLSYLKTFNPDPVVNSAFAPYGRAPVGTLGDFIYPKIDVVGASANGEITAIDAVLNGEIAYQRKVPYNIGSNFFGGALPGFGGIARKNVLVSSIRLDKQLRLQHLLGTNAPSFASLQLFDTWIQSFEDSDDLIQLAGFGAKVKEHTTILSGFVTFPFHHGTVNPQLAFGADLSNGDAFLIPSVEFHWGDHWRFLAEADLFFPKSQKRPGEIETRAHPIGGFANNSQLLFRATYQF